MSQIDHLIGKERGGSDEPFLLDLEKATKIINLIKSTHDDSVGKQWDEVSFISSMEYLSLNADCENARQVWCIVWKDRSIGRIRQDGKYGDAPDTPKGDKGELRMEKSIAKDIPSLILLRQNGEEGENKWRGAGCVLVACSSDSGEYKESYFFK